MKRERGEMSRSLPVFYNCDRCAGYCCSYPRIEATPGDIRRQRIQRIRRQNPARAGVKRQCLGRYHG